jgi:transposase
VQGAAANDKNREALGRSRSDLTSKVHLLADSGSRPLARVTSAGHRHDSLAFAPLMGRLKVARRGPGRPRTRPERVLGDKAYSSAAIRAHLRRRTIKATVPEPADQVKNRLRRGSKGGRPPAFDAAAYKQRNVVERRSASSASTAPWRPGMTSATSSGAAPSTSPRSGSGSVIPSHDLRDRL